VKKPLTAEIAETAEKKTLTILGLCGKTAHFFKNRHQLSGQPF